MAATLLLFIALLTWPVQAHAYLDPGTGSYVIQVAIAAIAGGAYALKLFGHRIKTFFTKGRSSRRKEDSQE